jgi:hypothetical protein
LCLLSSTKVRQFFGSKFFYEKRSAAGNRDSKDICLENNEKHMCLAAVKIKMKGIDACLGFQNNSAASSAAAKGFTAGDRYKICLSQDCFSQSRGMDTYENT